VIQAAAGSDAAGGGAVEPYRVFAIRYATLVTRRAHVILGAADDEGPMRLDYFVWAIVGNGRVVVVDTGCQQHVAARRGRDWLRCPTEGLRALGIDAAAVEDVIITHLHYDHAGNLALFPKARFHVQEREVQFATGRMMCNNHGSFTLAIEVDDVVDLVRATYARRVTQHDGEVEFAPGIRLHRVGGHTPGSQVVSVWTARGWVVLASDASHFYENLNSGQPFHLFVDLAAMFDGWRRVRQLASAPDNIVPGHDPLVMDIYPAAGPGLEEIAVRLDVAPTRAVVTASANY